MIRPGRHFCVHQRIVRGELMDAPNVDPQALGVALRGVARLNCLSGTAGRLWRPLAELARRTAGGRLTIGDIGCGNGDVMRRLARRAQRHGWEWTFVGYDVSPVAVAAVNTFGASTGLKTRGELLDVVSDEFPEQFDAVICSLFLHHLGTDDAVRVLSKVARAARHLVVLSDLRRSRLGYALAHVACRLFTRSPIVHTDGPRSVAAAFRIDEVQELCRRASIGPVRIVGYWPERMLLSWSTSSQDFVL